MSAAPPQRPHAPQSLRALAAGFTSALPDVPVYDLTLDSRAVTPGALFLACAGGRTHGLEFAAEAAVRGARAILYEPVAGEGATAALAALSADIVVAPVPRLRSIAGLIADRFFGAPSSRLTVAGITGTNGKTTSAWLLAQALGLCGRPTAYAGTLGTGLPAQLAPATHTTPDAITVHRQLAQLRAAGAACVAMEVSSHALDQERVAGVRFDAAVFTNLTRDHLDYHHTMEAYGAAKSRLFAMPELAWRVLNLDDAFGARLAATGGPGELIVTSRMAPAELPGGARWVLARRVAAESAGLCVEVETSWGSAELALRLAGEFNVDNALAVLAVLLAWQVPLAQAISALGRCRPASGRMELFGGRGRVPLAIVDYAHTPDALGKALRAARAHCRGALRVVFGCGGDRDPGKRPLMGQIAAELADEVLVTDDNPRSEDPGRIVADILAGVPAALRAHVVVEHDRAQAIRLALQRSERDDAVLIAGKGHEDYQIHGSTRRPFSDQAVVQAALAGGQA